MARHCLYSLLEELASNNWIITLSLFANSCLFVFVVVHESKRENTFAVLLSFDDRQSSDRFSGILALFILYSPTINNHRFPLAHVRLTRMDSRLLVSILISVILLCQVALASSSSCSLLHHHPIQPWTRMGQAGISHIFSMSHQMNTEHVNSSGHMSLMRDFDAQIFML